MKKIYFAFLALCLVFVSCTDDLDQKPHVGMNTDLVFSTIDGYESVLAKIYASFTLFGNQKADGADFSTLNGQDFSRTYFELQECTTDEAALRWVSGGNMRDLPYLSWDANNATVSDTYYKLYYSIALCNEYLRHCSDSDISDFSADEQRDIRTYAAEARLMRAFSYSIILDLFRKGPKVDETTPTSGVIPDVMDANGIIEFIEDEVAQIESELLDNPPYARAGKGVAYTMLARMYLNAETYTGTARYDDCIANCKKVMALGYSLEPEYAKLFNADNYKRTNEIILSFVNDATNATTWGGSTYLICGCVGSDNKQTASDYGISTGWGNFRPHGQFYDLFEDNDKRKMFFTTGQTQYITNLEDGTMGYHACKWTNLTDEGEAASNTAADGCSTDIIFYRLADVYLMAAEAVVRGGNGMSRTEALMLVNDIRERAYGDNSGNISDSQMSLDFFIDERGRELYLEYVRRTDLVRFNLFTTADYLWNWKGGVRDGSAVDSRFNYFPIPATEISANPNLSNPQY